MAEHFFIAGAQRSATTYLYRMLEQHPAIELARPVRPEPKYFIRDAPSTELADYRREFFHDPDARWYGEKSTSYIEHPVAAERIARMLPNARIIFMLRDPVERAISNYRFSVDNGLETLALHEALDQEQQRVSSASGKVSVSPFAYAGRGHYVRYLDQWCRWFPQEQIELVTTESLVGSEDRVRTLFSSLGVDPDIPLSGADERVNDSVTAAARDVPEDVLSRLCEEFRESNEQLRRHYGVDTSPWR